MIHEKLINKIKKNSYGIPIDQFIEICLFEKNSYYRNSNPINKNGDFTTAPEISQLFGEIIGLYVLNYWQKKIKKDFNLIELGPGNGTLIKDIINITKKNKDFQNSASINLVEINEKLIAIQKKNIKFKKIKWVKNLIDIKSNTSIIIANEFFDCLPIKQFIKKKSKWYEKTVNFNSNELRFFFDNFLVENKKKIKKLEQYFIRNNLNENELIEISEKRENYFDKVCKYIKKNSGIILIFDYGYYDPINYSTIQTISKHKNSHLFENLGTQDITSLVNFKKFNEIAIKNKLVEKKIFTQKDFLVLNGILLRKKIISLNSSIKTKKNIDSSLKRLISNKEMGEIFKCFICSDSKLNE